MTIATRAATVADMPLIAALIRGLAEYEGLSHAVRMDEAVLERHLFGPRPMAEVLIGELNDQPSGFALFFHNFSTFEGHPGVWLEDLFVVPSARRSGLGRKLLGEVARIAVERGCARMEWSVLDWNMMAINFYRSLGARPLTDWTTMRLDADSLAQLGANEAVSSA
ncbi:GNAT family N-acetyltransferase [Novosphingobium sp. Gsoil 351]|uniref:GNAT family N-acetyltransferase n=1 Tax=Novosphingobium sp. Gsoil 351 TaxID=2675225 RepID=UPI0012B4C378|nr:GNAT family N-acetyltransferase [Novosphingobium sp. Gsoil 351]QGN55391.1 GNAT family N-acetyltransferase [Novosphingobium sp. Gsoil 351]